MMTLVPACSQYGFVSQGDLWHYLTEAGHREGTLYSHLALSTIMDSWIRKEGYPVIKVVKIPINNSATVYQVNEVITNCVVVSITYSTQWRLLDFPVGSAHFLYLVDWLN